MIAIVYWLNYLSSVVVDVLVFPLKLFSPFWSLTFVALITSLLLLPVFGKISNQEKIKKTKNLLRAHILSIRLFSEYLSVFFKIQLALLKDLAVYLRYNLTPFLILMVPLFLLLAQLNLRYAKQPLRPGESSLVKVLFNTPDELKKVREIKLIAPEGVEVETPAVRAFSTGEVAWRVRAKAAGEYNLTIAIDEQNIEKNLLVGGSQGEVSTMRTATLGDFLLYPGELPLKADSGVQKITVSYPDLELSLAGFQIHWIVLFFLLTLIFTFSLKGLFQVEI
ncbi:MAG: hypothetical protein CR997_08505 [Acidobacteria bacterium]|nr:MAG: hypothetical protein CR997_08505 [Acidobacteriota bacterium]